MTRQDRLTIVAIALVWFLPSASLQRVLEASPAAQATTPVQATASAEVRSRVTVAVPHRNAEVLIDGREIAGEGTTREFVTPALEGSRPYKYTIAVKWNPNGYTVLTRTRTVEFTGGEDVAVDLTKEDPTDRAEVKFVPTPPEVVAAMVDLAAVTKDDVVYEPGCGDARITIAAVKAGAGRGVGIDINPVQVAESKARVEAEGLQDKIDIRLGDALDIKDLSNATVVFLYMGDEFDMLIRPILWQQLRVGARVVSHRFRMGDWAPDKTTNLEVEILDGASYDVHLWTITEEIKRRAANR